MLLDKEQKMKNKNYTKKMEDIFNLNQRKLIEKFTCPVCKTEFEYFILKKQKHFTCKYCGTSSSKKRGVV